MQEKNIANLREALNRLPSYPPPTEAWEGIAGELKPVLADKLPTYTPSATVWNSISRDMAAADVVAAKQRLARQRSLPLRRLAGVAAAVALLLVCVFAVNRYQDRQIVTVAYSQEAAPAPFVDDSGLDEASFKRAIAEIEARNDPTLNSLHHELVELTEATQDIKAMLASYGDDPKVIRQLAEIERDRSDIYRRIIVIL